MTIAAGYVASDGVLICADTEHADDVAKYKKPKAFKLKQHLIVTGAGNSHLLKVATDRLFRTLAQPPADANAALDIVGDVIYELHERHIFNRYDAASHLRPTLSLIVAVRCADGKLTLIKTQDDSAAFGGAYASAGSGSHLFEYWASHFFDRQLDTEAASYLLLFVLREVKHHVPGCGGDSHVWVLNQDTDRWSKSGLVDEDVILAEFPRSVAQLLVDCIDYPATSDGRFKESTENFVRKINELRESLKATRSIETQRQLLSTFGTSTLRPSQE